MVTACFADGGPSIGNRADTPELPYFRAVLADVEAHYCVDRSKVFVSGNSSGAWEAITLGCAASDVIRGFTSYGGGLRNARPPCKGPVAALLIAGTADASYPIGPLDPSNPVDKVAIDRLGSFGLAPARDELLQRNGCVGTATAVWDPAFPLCRQFTGCPPAFPVVWCELPGIGRNPTLAGGVQYLPGPMWKFLSALP
jgi:polyhydroxybutyrate depolymerase